LAAALPGVVPPRLAGRRKTASPIPAPLPAVVRGFSPAC
jgi:hypothetical protein